MKAQCTKCTEEASVFGGPLAFCQLHFILWMEEKDPFNPNYQEAYKWAHEQLVHKHTPVTGYFPPVCECGEVIALDE